MIALVKVESCMPPGTPNPIELLAAELGPLASYPPPLPVPVLLAELIVVRLAS